MTEGETDREEFPPFELQGGTEALLRLTSGITGWHVEAFGFANAVWIMRRSTRAFMRVGWCRRGKLEPIEPERHVLLLTAYETASLND